MSKLKHPKVFLVEDDLETRRLLEECLKSEQCRVHSFSFGGEAVEAFEQDPDFDLAMLDMQLPQMNGLQIGTAIRKLSPKIPIIVVTGFPESDQVEQLKQMGNCKVLNKPFKTQEITQLIQQLKK